MAGGIVSKSNVVAVKGYAGEAEYLLFVRRDSGHEFAA